MKRRELLTNTVKTGACACAMMFLGGEGIAFADDKKKEQEKKEKEDKNREFISNWTETLMLTMDGNLDEKTKTKIMEISGRKCAERTYKQFATKFKGNIKGFLETVQKQWAEKTIFDEKKGVITVHGKKTKGCFCPLAAGKPTFKTGTFCLCSRGWMTEIFETVTAKKVKVELLSTILTGGDHCVFQITMV